jgi:predicted Zn-dependent peptidase
MEVERGVILEELRGSQDRPDELVSDLIQERLFPNHPLGRNILGTEPSLKNLTADSFAKYHAAHYTSRNLVVAVSGQLKDVEAIKATIEAWFGGLEAQPAPTFSKFTDDQKQVESKIVTKPELQQAFLAMAVKGITNNDPRRFAMGVLNSYLGRGFTSRFYEQIREKRGLCYSIHSGDDRFADTGYWAVFAGLNKDRLDEAASAIVAEMKLVRDQLISPPKLEESKEKVRGPMIFSMENPVHQMDFYAKQVLDKPDDVLDYDTVIARVMGVTAQQVQELAQDIFKTEKLNLALVGPVKDTVKDTLVKLLQL